MDPEIKYSPDSLEDKIMDKDIGNAREVINQRRKTIGREEITDLLEGLLDKLEELRRQDKEFRTPYRPLFEGFITAFEFAIDIGAGGKSRFVKSLEYVEDPGSGAIILKVGFANSLRSKSD